VNTTAVKAGPLASAIYEGRVRHRRYSPHAHAFSYRIAFVLLDLAEIDTVMALHPLYQREGRAIATFRRSDYLGDPALPLDEAVRHRAFEALGRRPEGPIRLLTHLRFFGHCFNPVSFYYCYAADGETLDCIVAEITNTPWKERHSYVLDCVSAVSRGSAQEWQFPKAFHVSPFIPMQRGYCWRLTAPGRSLQVHMQVLEEIRTQFPPAPSQFPSPGTRRLRRDLRRPPGSRSRVWPWGCGTRSTAQGRSGA
jgi:DUF1365 family protein